MARLDLQGGEYDLMDDDFSMPQQNPMNGMGNNMQGQSFNQNFNNNPNMPFNMPQQNYQNNRPDDSQEVFPFVSDKEEEPERSYQDAYSKLTGEQPNLSNQDDEPQYSFNSGKNNYNTFSESDKYEYNNMIINRKKIKVNKPLLIASICIIAYVGFLIIGFMGTTYRVDEGQKKAVVATIKDREAREDYEELKIYYLDMVSMMSKAEDYEYQMEKSLTPYYTLSANYEDILTTIDTRITKVQSLSLGERCSSLKMMESESYNYIAQYCQMMQKALLNDDLENYKTAMEWKEVAYQSMEKVRVNLVDMGATDAKIYDDEDIAKSILDEPSPEDAENPEDQGDNPINGGHYDNTTEEATDEPLVEIPNSDGNNGLGKGRNGSNNDNGEQSVEQQNNVEQSTEQQNNVEQSTEQQNNSNDDDNIGLLDDGNSEIENPYTQP